MSGGLQEDAAFFKRFRGPSLAALSKGVSREDVVRNLVSQGVPDQTADRIATAVGLEHEAVSARKTPRGKAWAIAGISIAAIIGFAIYIALQFSDDGTLKLKYLAPALIVSLIVSAIVVQRLVLRVRGPHDLPPPPNSPR